MRMLDQLREKQDAIGAIGDEERASARSDGVSSFYSDPVDGMIVEEKTDGTKIIHSHPFVAKPRLHAAE